MRQMVNDDYYAVVAFALEANVRRPSAPLDAGSAAAVSLR